MGSRLLRLFAVVLLQLLLQLVEGQELPSVPDYFSGYVETLTTSTIAPGEDYFSYNISRQFIDKTLEMSRTDGPADFLYPGVPGVLSIIMDLPHKVMYMLQRDTRNCSIEPIQLPIGGGGIVVNPDGSYHFGNLWYLVNASDYTYVGNSSAHGVILDNWTFTGDITVPNISYHNVTIDLSIARNGAPYLHGTSAVPVPWRIAIQGPFTFNNAFNLTINSVSRLFDISLEEPHEDVFDVSMCAEPKDYVVLVMVVPKNSSKVDYITFNKNVKKAVVEYTQVFPIQVGAIEVILDNETALFTTVQISNLTTKVTVPNVVTAVAALDKISMNSVDGALPFQIEIASGVMVTPFAVEVYVDDGPPKPLPSSVMPFPTTSSTSMMPSPPSMHSSATGMSSPPSMHSSVMGISSSLPPHSSVLPSPPQMSSNVVPSPSTTTVTITITPSSCPTAAPVSTGKTYSQGYLIGVAFGMIILGIVVTLLAVFVIIFLCTRSRKFSFRTGYERQINVDD